MNQEQIKFWRIESLRITGPNYLIPVHGLNGVVIGAVSRTLPGNERVTMADHDGDELFTSLDKAKLELLKRLENEIYWCVKDRDVLEDELEMRARQLASMERDISKKKKMVDRMRKRIDEKAKAV